MRSISWIYLSLIMLILLPSQISGEPFDRIEEALNASKYFQYEVILDGDSFSDITGDQCFYAFLAIELIDGAVPAETTAVIVKRGDSMIPYQSLEEYISSGYFLEGLDADFRLLGESDAARFQDFLYLIDDNYFHEGYFVDENSWYFVRDEFFGDLDVWIVKTTPEGRISSIEHRYDLEIALPEEMLGVDVYSDYDRYGASAQLTPEEREEVKSLLESRLNHTLLVEPLAGAPLETIWEGSWYRGTVSSDYQDQDGYPYTLSTEILVYETDTDILLFGYLPDALGWSGVVDSMSAGFSLESDEGAELFEEALDIILHDDAPNKSRFRRAENWYFIRDEWFDDLEGVVVALDPDGRIASVYYDYYIVSDSAMTAQDVEDLEPFDESLVDWTLYRIEPEQADLVIVQGQGIPVAFDFDAYAASRLGAWMLTMFDGEMWGVDYDSEGMWSPYYDWIPPEALTIGEHTISYILMRPGMNLDEALGRLDLSVRVEPFVAPEGNFDLRLITPDSTTIHAPPGESIPLSVTFDAESARRYGVNLVLRHQGEVVGGQNSTYLESPFQITVPAEVLTPGTHLVEVQLTPPGEPGDQVLTSCVITIHVE